LIHFNKLRYRGTGATSVIYRCQVRWAHGQIDPSHLSLWPARMLTKWFSKPHRATKQFVRIGILN